MTELLDETNAQLHRDLIKLGDMIGDGLHREPGGQWINKEYRKVLKALGMLPPRQNNTARIDEHMIKRISDVSCGNCNGQLKQTRSGSKRAYCLGCNTKWQLLK